ncbi:MAG: PAS domain-containing protein, partial [Pyrinomonadaceae bacterium]
MRGGPEERNEAEVALGRRLWWLIAGRVVAAVVLLLTSPLWGRGWLVGTNGVHPGWLRGTLLIGGVTLLLSLLYAAVLRLSAVPRRVQAGVQLLFDVLIVTWLVWASGYVRSPYTALYIVIISVASVFMGARGALITSVGCSVAYISVMLASALGWLPGGVRGTTAAFVAEAAEPIGLNVVAFFFVGLLAARLAERQARSDVQLIEAAHALASLRALHERIVESIRSGVVTTDLQRRIYTFNSAAEEMTGYGAAAMRGQDVSILFGDITGQIEDSIRAAAEGSTSPRFEADCLTAEGLRVRLGYSIFPLSAEGGEMTGLVITFQDLTHIRAIEDTARRQDRLAAVGRVAAGIAHEIRNPLAAMRGSIQVLRSEMDG